MRLVLCGRIFNLFGEFLLAKKGVSSVLVHTGWSIALYCQRCGKIQIHDISYFAPQNKPKPLRCSCNHTQAVLARDASNRYFLQIPCGVCKAVYEKQMHLRYLQNLKFEKIYCKKDHFELGYIGKRKFIAEVLDFNQREFKELAAASDEPIEQQQILLDVVNRVHDMAEQGNIVCPCGSEAIKAGLVGDTLFLECVRCGCYRAVAAKTEADLLRLHQLDCIELVPPQFRVKNIDLD